mgnify:CR=1 FL=1
MTKGWDNHEDTFEEKLRRELVAARETIFLLKDDIKELTKNKTLTTRLQLTPAIPRF